MSLWSCYVTLEYIFGMLLGVTHCAQIFMVILCCTRPYLEKKCESFKLLIKKVFCNMKACTLGSVLSYFPLSSKSKKTELKKASKLSRYASGDRVKNLTLASDFNLFFNKKLKCKGGRSILKKQSVSHIIKLREAFD